MVDRNSLGGLKGSLAIGAAVLIGVIAIAVLLSGVLSYGSVGEGEVAVETNFGEATGEVYESNRYWAGNPLLMGGFTHGTDHMTVEPVTMQMEVTEGLSSDGQDINTVVSVTYALESDQAYSFYSDSEQSRAFTGGVSMWEDRIGERTVTTAVQDGSASVSALEIVQEYETEDGANVETLRTELQDEVEQQLREENEKVSPEIEIISVRVETVELSDELNNGLEEIAVEQAESERQLVDAQADADAERARAEGRADAFDTIVRAYGGEQKALQAEWIEAINEDEGTIVIDAEAAPILDMNTQTSGNSTSTSTGTTAGTPPSTG